MTLRLPGKTNYSVERIWHCPCVLNAYCMWYVGEVTGYIVDCWDKLTYGIDLERHCHWMAVVGGDIHEDLSISHHMSIQRRSVRLLMSTSQPAISKWSTAWGPGYSHCNRRCRPWGNASSNFSSASRSRYPGRLSNSDMIRSGCRLPSRLP